MPFTPTLLNFMTGRKVRKGGMTWVLPGVSSSCLPWQDGPVPHRTGRVVLSGAVLPPATEEEAAVNSVSAALLILAYRLDFCPFSPVCCEAHQLGDAVERKVNEKFICIGLKKISQSLLLVTCLLAPSQRLRIHSSTDLLSFSTFL